MRHDHGIALNETVIPKLKILKKKVKFDSLPLRYVGHMARGRVGKMAEMLRKLFK